MLLCSRRWLVGRSLAAGLLLGCGDERMDPAPRSVGCDEPAGEPLAPAPFAETPSVPLDEKIGVGWDARLYRDLSDLSEDELVTPTELFYIRTEHPDLLDPGAPWQVQIHGLVERPATLSMAQIEALSVPQGVHLLECSGNSDGGAFGLMSAAEWRGAPLSEVLALAPALSRATRVLVSGFDEHSVPSAGGHSTPGASWIFTFDQLSEAFLATHMNGAVLPPDHGFPVRLFVPGWYGCCAIKWVNEIELVDERAPATSQMKEFASRTHQDGVPELAADYAPATMDQAAMPVRVEKWLHEGAIVYRLVGILWGGSVPTRALTISFDGGQSYEPVSCVPQPIDNRSWSLWSHRWRPPAPGSYVVRMGVDDPAIRTRRLDLGWYDRTVVIDEV